MLRRLLLLLITLAAVLAGMGTARAANLETAIAPGPVIQGHAKVEEKCESCHKRFDRAAQDRLCGDCHKDIAADVRDRLGYHGRQKPQACKTCHTDHKGRTARIVDLDPKKFDHRQTDWVLKGKHAETKCADCHKTGVKWREAPQDCNSCHKKDDVHKGGLGVKCADCHNEKSWKEVAAFDHDKTRFALTGKHDDVKCADCHKTREYRETPRTCIGCHKKDDESNKGHKGQFGTGCEKCHDTKGWKPQTFRHDVDTKYPLRGKHRDVKCTDCHTTPLYRTKTATECVACHKKDDDGPKGHKGNLGRDCAACHTERDWKEPAKFDHDKARFALLGKHVDVKCTDCHKTAEYRDAPSDCYSCHKKDDKHERTLGEKCADCHAERSWKDTQGLFVHDRTRFPLRNAHAAKKVECKGCHRDLKSLRDTARDCLSCHKKDDKHEGTLGARCEQCHDDAKWKVTRYDHGRTRFPLAGGHIGVECKDCHKSLRFREASRECVACHVKDDVHKERFGTQCASCHNVRDWRLWAYDHAKSARYPLEGAHAKVACETCHVRPAPKGKAAAPLGTACIACHRRDDAHDGAFGTRCEQCHVAQDWKTVNPQGRRPAAPPAVRPDGATSSRFPDQPAARPGRAGGLT